MDSFTGETKQVYSSGNYKGDASSNGAVKNGKCNTDNQHMSLDKLLQEPDKLSMQAYGLQP